MQEIIQKMLQSKPKRSELSQMQHPNANLTEIASDKNVNLPIAGGDTRAFITSTVQVKMRHRNRPQILETIFFL